MYKMMKKLIARKFYATSGEIRDKLDVFFLVGRITDEEYTELNADVAEFYAE